jgi:V8-like Glu-specific endopeptidase
MGGSSLSIDPTEAGQSGSPILNDAGQAVGVIVIGTETGESGKRINQRSGPQPILMRNLPGWLL